MVRAEDLKVKIFADGADLDGIMEMYANPLIKGFTTNPTLMRKAGITDYEAFAAEVLSKVPRPPVSFEVFADDFDEMERQALEIASWGKNVNVKIPVTNTKGEFAGPLVERSVRQGRRAQRHGVMTLDQVRAVADASAADTPAIVSVFAGRIADTGRRSVPMMAECRRRSWRRSPKAELIWASPRELLNIFQADEVGCHIITATTTSSTSCRWSARTWTEYLARDGRDVLQGRRRRGFNIDRRHAASRARPRETHMKQTCRARPRHRRRRLCRQRPGAAAARQRL